jgi:hypothetical protein
MCSIPFQLKNVCSSGRSPLVDAPVVWSTKAGARTKWTVAQSVDRTVPDCGGKSGPSERSSCTEAAVET